MKSKMQTVLEKHFDPRQHLYEPYFVLRENRKIIGVANIVFDSKITFYKLIELVHVNVYEELRGEVTKWQPNARTRRI